MESTDCNSQFKEEEILSDLKQCGGINNDTHSSP